MTEKTRPVVVSHGGAGGPKENTDGCEVACEAGLAALREGESALESAVRATMVLEDDPRLNAGIGSNFRLDGRTIEMDAAVMDHRFRFGAVAAIQRVQYPVQVAEMVMGSPHLLLCGEGATRFAHARGVPDFYPVSERAHERYALVRKFFAGLEDTRDFVAWKGRDPVAYWNLPADIEATLKALAGPSDTVGAVVRDANGDCAVALSTGGTSIMLLGRVGDTPIIGAGLYAGSAGAVTTTGDGEEIMRRLLAKEVYDWITDGMPAQEAVERGVNAVPEEFTVGVIAVSARDEGVADNRTMPAAVMYLE
jgi:L-asparaginase/beta-aspartyl-peptidase (threonine type)